MDHNWVLCCVKVDHFSHQHLHTSVIDYEVGYFILYTNILRKMPSHKDRCFWLLSTRNVPDLNQSCPGVSESRCCSVRWEVRRGGGERETTLNMCEIMWPFRPEGDTSLIKIIFLKITFDNYSQRSHISKILFKFLSLNNCICRLTLN